MKRVMLAFFFFFFFYVLCYMVLFSQANPVFPFLSSFSVILLFLVKILIIGF